VGFNVGAAIDCGSETRGHLRFKLDWIALKSFRRLWANLPAAGAIVVELAGFSLRRCQVTWFEDNQPAPDAGYDRKPFYTYFNQLRKCVELEPVCACPDQTHLLPRSTPHPSGLKRAQLSR
jgi:hypothetical protein